MANYQDVTKMAASLMNDTAQTVYTDAAILPYLNMSLDELQEIFSNNNLPITNAVSETIAMTAGVTRLDFDTTPALPTDLLEIQRLWESLSGQAMWIPMVRQEFLEHYAEDVLTNNYRFWAWVNQGIDLPATNQDNDLKLDYIATRFPNILIDEITDPLPVLNSKTYLGYHTASLCAMFIGENETRAQALAGLAEDALSRTLGINNKGRQSITTRRRPFRASYKLRGGYL